MKRRSLLTAILFLSMLTVSVSCSNPGTKSSDTPPAQSDIKVGFSAWPGWFPWQVSQDKKSLKRTRLSLILSGLMGILNRLVPLLRVRLMRIVKPWEIR